MNRPDDGHPTLERLRRRKEQQSQRSRLYRIGVVAAGSLLVLVGVIIIPVPGPWSLPLILAGLVLLALEFDWAEKFLVSTIRRAEAARETAAEASRARKVLGGPVFAAGLAAVVASAVVWDVPLLPV